MKTRRDERHGETEGPEYAAWRAMIARCHRPTHPSYPLYGARGIHVCDHWRASFVAFLADMGRRPDGGELDRIDNDRGYDPSNCRWATRAAQMRNTRRTRMITIGDRTQCIADWCKENGIRPSLASTREANGWDVVRAVTQPPHPKPWRKGITGQHASLLARRTSHGE